MNDPAPFNPDDLPDDLRGRIKAELVPGERLLWAARAMARPFESPGCYLFGGFLGLAMFTVGGIALKIYFSVQDRPRNRFDGYLVPLMLTMCLGGFVIVLSLISCLRIQRGEIRKFEMRFYALTDRRAIIWVPSEQHAGAVEMHSISPRMVGRIYRVENANGSGDVVFIGSKDVPYLYPRGFEGVPDVRRVEDLVRQILVNPAATTEQFDDDDDTDFM